MTNTPTEADVEKVLTVAQLRDWLKTKPSDKRYVYIRPESCLVAQYLKARFPSSSVLVGSALARVDEVRANIPASLDDIAFKTAPKTFGEALLNCEKYLDQ